MRGDFGLKLQNSPKLPHIHARLYCNANENQSATVATLVDMKVTAIV